MPPTDQTVPQLLEEAERLLKGDSSLSFQEAIRTLVAVVKAYRARISHAGAYTCLGNCGTCKYLAAPVSALVKETQDG